MKTYEMVREIPNLCANNQMRDIFFEEVETDDPVAYVKSILKGNGLSQNSNRIERCTKTWQGMCAGGGLEPPARSITRPQAAQNAQLSNWSCAFCTGAGS